MSFNEDAALSYNPDDESSSSELQVAVADATKLLGHLSGVHGLGESKLSNGNDAIVVYVENESVLAKLPRNVRGIPVVGEITGEIRPL